MGAAWARHEAEFWRAWERWGHAIYDREGLGQDQARMHAFAQLLNERALTLETRTKAGVA